jgi:hypothetical protein
MEEVIEKVEKILCEDLHGDDRTNLYEIKQKISEIDIEIEYMNSIITILKRKIDQNRYSYPNNNVSEYIILSDMVNLVSKSIGDLSNKKTKLYFQQIKLEEHIKSVDIFCRH